MGLKYRLIIAILVVAGLALTVVRYFQHHAIAVLDPKGPVAAQERNLIVFTLLLVLIVVIPVYLMTVGIAWRYRAGNKKARYSPELDGNRAAEAAWWLIPTAIISVLAVVAWRSSHTLDPFRPLKSTNKQMTIQVVAMDWKWLFIYPEQNIASVNYVNFPVNTPIDFAITSDAPMNSFWIPQLGGQIYAMAGMETHLHLEASQIGNYYGSSANISGRGFASMDFTAAASSSAAFRSWVDGAHLSARPLDMAAYNSLARPSQNNPVTLYSSAEADLYGNVLARFMVPGMGDYVR